MRAAAGMRATRRVVGSAAAAAALAMAPGCGSATPPPSGPAPGASTQAGPAPPQSANPAYGPVSAANSGDRLANVTASAFGPVSDQPEPSVFRFEDVAPGSGVDFKHVSGMTPEKHFPTANGSGVALLDYDGDGRLDVYFATATPLPVGLRKTGSNKLYKNLGGGKFRDETAASGLGFEGFCHGIIAGDLDGDGDPDVMLCNYGPNSLFLNNGDGTFRDVSRESGIGRPGWSSGGTVIDYDGDGDLDLYVTNYGLWDIEADGKQACHADGKPDVRLYCSPTSVRTTKHFLYRNEGVVGGVPRFKDAIDEFLVDADGKPMPGRSDGHGFGAVASDVDGDGKVDLYVANDMNPNFLFLNQGAGKFRDVSEESAAAFDEKGHAQSGMGVDSEDVNGDGRPELFVTNFQGEYNTLYENLGNATFYDQTTAFGLAADSVPTVGWGCLLGDFDGDGWPDAFVTNGHVDDNRAETSYAEPALLHRNVAVGGARDGTRKFRLSTRDAGPYFAADHVGRGAAFGDLDDDGRLDIVVNHKDGAPAILMNRTPRGDNHWVRLKLRGTASNRDAVGARVEVEAAGRVIHRQKKGGASMLSTNDPRVLIGVGPATKIDSLTVRWPSGAPPFVLKDLAIDREYEVVEPKP